MSSLIGGVVSSATSTVGSTVNVGATVGATVSNSSSSTGSTASSGTTTSSGSGVATSTPGVSTPLQTNFDKRAFAMVVGQVIYLNEYNSFAGINTWQPLTVGYVYGDGNALLVSEPNIAIYTGGLLVGFNLRRIGQLYADMAAGP